jgi:class 3 adenylate cyclase
MASFPTATEAIRVGRALVDSLASVGMQLRVGVHLGEVTQTASDLEGVAVNVAARVCDEAEGGSVYVTAAARDAADSSILFEGAGSHELKGLPTPWQLFKAM